MGPSGCAQPQVTDYAMQGCEESHVLRCAGGTPSAGAGILGECPQCFPFCSSTIFPGWLFWLQASVAWTLQRLTLMSLPTLIFSSSVFAPGSHWNRAKRTRDLVPCFWVWKWRRGNESKIYPDTEISKPWCLSECERGKGESIRPTTLHFQLGLSKWLSWQEVGFQRKYYF